MFGGYQYSGSARLLHDGTFEELPPLLSSPHAMCSATRVGDYIYVIGGVEESYTMSSSFERLHIPTHTWSSLASLPKASMAHVSVEVNGRIYVIGGLGNDVYNQDIQVFDINRNKWMLTGSVPTSQKIYSPCCVSVSNTIYIFGGEGVKTVGSFVIGAGHTKTWKTLKNMEYEHFDGKAIEIDSNRILVLGGKQDGSYLDIVEEYNIITNSWKTLTWKLPYAMSCFAAWYESFSKTLHVAFGDRVFKSPIHKRMMDDNENPDKVNGWTMTKDSLWSPIKFGSCT